MTKSLLSLLTLLLAATPALAQATVPTTPASVVEAPAVAAEDVTVTDEVMQEFVKVNGKLNTVQREFDKAMSEAGEDAKKSEAAMMSKGMGLQKAFEETTLSIEEYSRIAKALPNSPALQTQFAKFLK